MAQSMVTTTLAARERAPRRRPCALMCPRHRPRRPASLVVRRRRQRRLTLTMLQIHATVSHMQLSQAHVQPDLPWSTQLEARNHPRLHRRRTRQGASAAPVAECDTTGTTTSDNSSTTRATTSRATAIRTFLLRAASRRCPLMPCLRLRDLRLHPLPKPNPPRRRISPHQR